MSAHRRHLRARCAPRSARPSCRSSRPAIPTSTTTEALLLAMARAGADVIELGVPFSDPIADGPVIQAASARALAAGTTLRRILDLVARCAPRRGVPIVLFSYFNPFLPTACSASPSRRAARGWTAC